MENDVLHVIEAFNRAFAENDAERYFSHVDRDITVITPSNPYRVDGIDADRAEFEAGLRSGATRVHFFQELQPKVQLLGDAAVVTYYSRGSYGPPGAAKTAYLKETDVLARRDGRWKVVHVHVSTTAC
jgi:ketosteroid isomerase-like protein